MVDILIREVDESTVGLLRRRAQRHGKSLEADLREALEKMARKEAELPDDAEPFGGWLVAISRPGVDLDQALQMLRSAPVRSMSFE
ncbi:FitA-like ribbon-helix-helix domain-containing protein [Bradyrhizobium sp. STM 3557]|uniref:FitA-like ribbon-helix-helix domain-containing protein n=1 Tax=Bradyrhizobium sp. STM 3557 TaxID=578920 RepID=UPI00388F4859